MLDDREAIREIQAAFSALDYPEAFLSAYDQLECLSHHNGIETFLVQKKSDGTLHIAKCYDASLYEGVGEEDTLRKLTHPGIPAFGDVFCNTDMICTLRGYVEGVSLADGMRSGRMTRERITEVCCKLCDALIYLHTLPQPVIHRDIKPQNVILRPDGTPVLIDFDIARTFKGGADSDTRFFGTRGFAAPEQFGFTQTDARADVYSFGMLLRFLLTGSTRENPNVRIYKPLARIIDKCTAFSPKERFADMRAVKKALLAANPRAQLLRGCRIALLSLAACGLLAFGGVKLYEYATFDPFADGRIPAVMQDGERVSDALAYLTEKYGTHLFDETDAYVTVGICKDALVELYGMDYDYAHTPSPIDPPIENPDHFLPWSLGDEQYIDRGTLAYFVTKAYWPEVVSDWSNLKDDNGEYPGLRVAVAWCEEHGILTGVKRPRDVTRGETAIALANADRVYRALQEK